MNRQKNILIYFLIAIAIVQCSLLSSSKPDNLISLELNRVQVDPWIKNTTIPQSSCYNPSDIDSDYEHQYDIKKPDQCKDAKSFVKIMNQCIYVTTAYQTNFYFDTIKSDPFKMVLDLRTPWSWVKSPSCKQYTRNGTQFEENCSYPSQVKDSKSKFDKTYDCKKDCKVVNDKCGEIDMVKEGLSVSGSFISTKTILSDKDYRKKAIKGFKILQAHGLSGHQYLLGDGVLGLGKQHIGKDEDDNDERQNPNEEEDETINEQDEDDDEEEEDDEDDEKEKDKEKKKKPTKNSYKFFEHGTDLWSAIDRVYKKVNADVFALYLAEHDDIKPQLLIGEASVNMTDFIHLPEKHPLKWIKLPILKYDNKEELARSYFQWKIPVSQIVFRYGQIKKTQEDKTEKIVGYQNRTEILLQKETEAQLSLQTSALILPEEMMNQIISKLNYIYNMSCSVSKLFIKYVQCTDLEKPLDVSELAITIHVGYGEDYEELINIDPNNLLLGCKKSKSKYSCYFNLQLSPDDSIIFGDSVLRESYMVFDVEGRKIGLAPAKSKYNEKSFWREVRTIIEDVEDVIRGDIIFLLRFFLVLIVLSAILFLFVNWKKIYQMINRRIKYQSVIDPSEMASLDLDKSDMVIRYGQTDDQDVTEQIQELEQNESFDAL